MKKYGSISFTLVKLELRANFYIIYTVMEILELGKFGRLLERSIILIIFYNVNKSFNLL